MNIIMLLMQGKFSRVIDWKLIIDNDGSCQIERLYFGNKMEVLCAFDTLSEFEYWLTDFEE